MNNKILAVALSIIAVIVVAYQIFLRKDESVKPVRTAQFVNKTNGSAQHTVPRTNNPLQQTNNTQSDENIAETPNAMIIDIYSPELLKRVSPYIDNSRKEISGNYGENFFGYKKIKSNEPEKKEMEKPKLVLNGIIDLIRDKIKIAIINNHIYKKGETVMNATIKNIGKYEVVLIYNEETIILKVNQGTYKGWIKKEIGGNS